MQLLLALALLIGNTAAGLACRLAGSLALAAAAVLGALTQIAGLDRLDMLHNRTSIFSGKHVPIKLTLYITYIEKLVNSTISLPHIPANPATFPATHPPVRHCRQIFVNDSVACVRSFIGSRMIGIRDSSFKSSCSHEIYTPYQQIPHPIKRSPNLLLVRNNHHNDNTIHEIPYPTQASKN